MPMGITHRRINTTLSIPLTAGLIIEGWSPVHAITLAAGYNFATFFMNPDLDLNSIGYQSWGWLRFIWWPYQRALGHRCWMSHFPIISTILRIIYLFWFPIVLVFLLGSSVQAATREAIFDWWPVFGMYAIIFIVGMIISDSVHAILDVSSTELKEFLGGSRRRRHINFFQHHNQPPPRRAYAYNRDRRTTRRRR